MSNNTVDVSPERIAAEFATIRSEAVKVHPMPDTSSGNVTDNVNSDVKRESSVKIGANGFEIPDLPTGDLCCFAGGIAVNVYAPNWVKNGFNDQHLEMIGRPLGAVIDKYLDKYFPDSNLGDLIEPYKEEIALVYAAINIYATFGNIPRQIEGGEE